MSGAVTASVTELPESRVRLEAQVAADEVERRLQQTAKALGQRLRLPGFRRGKVPPPLVIQRMGREAVLDEAVRESLQGWYGEAIDAAGIEPIGNPSVDLSELPGQGEPLTFSVEIGVRPTARLGTYKGVEVGRREPEVAPEAVDAEVEALRDRFATLETAERAAETGDFVVLDYAGTIDGEPFAGGEGRDEMVELGGGRLLPGFEEQLTGAAAGEQRTVNVAFPDDYGATSAGEPSELVGKRAEFAVAVKEVKSKRLPELDDDFAAESAGFDTLAELREDIRARLEQADRELIESEFRDAVVDTVAAEGQVDLPDALVESQARHTWDQMAHAISHRGISREAYLRIAGQTEEQVIERAKPDAEQALRRNAVVAAVIEAEDIEPTEDDLLEALEPAAQREGQAPAELLESLRGRERTLRHTVAVRQAVDLLVEHAKAISVEQAKAREKLWTPGAQGDEGTAGGQLWTPDH